MKKLKILSLLTVAFMMTAIVFSSVSWTVTKADNPAELHVLWIQDYDNDGETAKFTIKTTASNTQIREDFNTAEFEKLTVNGYTLKDILYADDNASVKLDGGYLTVTLSAKGFPYCLTETDSDRIVIKQGFSFISGEVTPYDFTYTYDKIFRKYMVIPDPSLIDESRVTSSLLRDVVFDTTNERQLFIHFSYPACYEYMSCVQYDPQGMSQQFRAIGWTDPSDLFISQLSLLGIRDSILNNVLVDGKSLAEWMAIDGEYVADPQNLILIAFHGTGRDRARYMTVEFGKASSCPLTNNEPHTLTLKKGLTFPTLSRLNSDITLTYNPDTDVWGSEFTEKEVNRNDVNTGCSTAFTGTGAVTIVLVAVSACMIIKKLRGTNDEK